MNNSKDGGPAFPQVETRERDSEIYENTTFPDVTSKGGMSLKDWFAGQALAILLKEIVTMSDASVAALAKEHGLSGIVTREQVVALAAYKTADAMIVQRSKP